jgi:hypothetical protein
MPLINFIEPLGSGAWALLLAAVSGGGIGAVIAKSRADRAAAWRERLTPAADDFATGVVQSIIALRNACSVTDEVLGERDLALPSERVVSILDVKRVQDADAELVRCIDEAHARLARIEILFGPNSKAADAGTDAIVSLRRAVNALKEWPTPDLDLARIEWDRAHGAHGRFADAASAIIERGRNERSWSWLRFRPTLFAGRGTS